MGLNLCVLLVFALFAGRSYTDWLCPRDFESRCSCGKVNYNGRERYVVNCTNTNFQHPAMLENLPSETEVVIFTGNNITIMPWNIFGKMKEYPELDTIDMSNNNIREIKGKTYHRVQNVRTLILNHNDLNITDRNHPRIFSNFINLQSLHLTNAFTEMVDSAEYLLALEEIFIGSNLSKLEKLHLEQNEIKVFKNPNIFCNLPSLMDLQLGDNKLTEITFNFDCLNALRFIDLRNNKINHLSNHTLAKFESLPNRGLTLKIDLLGNPFFCDCKIADFLNWMRFTDVIILEKESYRCYDGLPSLNAEQYLLDIPKLQCTTAYKQEYQGTTILLGFLVVLLIVLVLIVGYMNYSSLNNPTNSLKKRFFRHDQQYSTILSKAVEEEVHV